MTYVAKHDSLTPLSVLLMDVERTLVGCNRAQLSYDLDLLAERVRSRGLTVIMDDLPKLGKLYDKGLSQGVLDVSSIPHSLKERKRVLFSSLLYRSFRPSGEFINPDPETVFCTRAILYLFKKVKHESSPSTNRRAMEEFYSIDQSLPDPDLDWGATDVNLLLGRSPSWANHPSADWRQRCILNFFSRVSEYFFSQSLWIDWDDYRPKHGPGAVSDMPSGSDKYRFPSWPNRLSQVFPSNGWASHVHDCTDDSLPESWGGVELTSRLICVPKTLSKPRVIASEPTAHMYCQQAIMTYLRSSMTNVAASCVDFHSQEISRFKCLKASEHGQSATIDLSNASDRLSLYVVERVGMPSSLLEALYASRTRYVVSEINPEPYLMRKFAPMGSAVTFPIQSLIYAAAATAAVYISNHRFEFTPNFEPKYNLVEIAARSVQVFGDDIIVPIDAVDLLNELLGLLFLKVNTEKSHVAGFFRESCGMDAYQGVGVTPLYLSAVSLGDSFPELVSWVEVANNAYRSGLWSLSEWMIDQIPKGKRQLIPVTKSDPGCVRLFTFQNTSLYPGKIRYKSELHRWEHRSICVQSRGRTERRHDWCDLLQYFVEGSKERYLAHLDPALTRVGHRTDYRTRVVVRWVAVK